MFPFRTKQSNLRYLNISACVSSGLLLLIGVPYAIQSWQRGKPYDILFIPAIFLMGLVVYGINRAVLSLSHREPRRQATPEEIEEARRMLYGDKEK